MHGQWDWMNDPYINSRNWDWDTASPAEAWRHSHNYEHHTFTNIRGKDRDLGYEIMRIDPHQPWHPVYLAPAALQPAADGLLRVGRGDARPQLRRHPRGREAAAPGQGGAAGDRRQGAAADRQGLHRLPGALRRARSARRWPPTSSRTSCATCGRTRSSSAGTSPTRPTPSARRRSAEETRGGLYVRQLLGAANIDGSPLFHLLSGQPELPGRASPLPDMPSSRYARSRPRVRDICRRYELPYNTGPLRKQLGGVHRTILRLAFPGGRPRPKPGPYRPAR